MGGFLKSKEFNGPDFSANQSGLSRYRSAPHSFLAALMDSAVENGGGGGGESEDVFISAFMNSGHRDLNHKGTDLIDQYHMKQESGGFDPDGQPRGEGYGHWQTGRVAGSYPVGMESRVSNNGDGFASGLVRQSSSPAGFFNEFDVLTNTGNFESHNHAKTGASANGRSSHISFTSFMPSIPEIGLHNSDRGQSSHGSSANSTYDSWNNDDPHFNGFKRNLHGELKMFYEFSGLENQGEVRKNPTGLVQNLSWPKTSAEMPQIDKYLQFQQDVVPCQLRAKRGCATHPRSIAERMRRTRISQKMKKLQNLFPDMDRQTNQADMLDLAVEYIKDLQKQVQTLSETRSKCICSSKTQKTSAAIM